MGKGMQKDLAHLLSEGEGGVGGGLVGEETRDDLHELHHGHGIHLHDDMNDHRDDDMKEEMRSDI